MSDINDIYMSEYVSIMESAGSYLVHLDTQLVPSPVSGIAYVSIVETRITVLNFSP